MKVVTSCNWLFTNRYGLQPSSSGRSAEILGTNVPQFFGLSAMKDSVFPTQNVPLAATDDIDFSVDSNFQLVLKKMNKKDSTTKLKVRNCYIIVINYVLVFSFKAMYFIVTIIFRHFRNLQIWSKNPIRKLLKRYWYFGFDCIPHCRQMLSTRSGKPCTLLIIKLFWKQREIWPRTWNSWPDRGSRRSTTLTHQQRVPQRNLSRFVMNFLWS